MEKIKLNLGCGTDIRRGYVNVDYQVFSGVDLQWNLEVLPLPFKDNSVKEIVLNNILEHLPNLPKFMLELYRISCTGAIIYIRVPHFTSRNTFGGDIEHRRGFGFESFFVNKYIQDRFEVLKNEIFFPPYKSFMRFVNLSNSLKRFYEHLPIIPANDMIFVLRVKDKSITLPSADLTEEKLYSQLTRNKKDYLLSADDWKKLRKKFER